MDEYEYEYIIFIIIIILLVLLFLIEFIKILNAYTKIYIYGYPLLIMDLTRKAMANTTLNGNFIHMRSYPEATFSIVSAPNADTLYSTSWIDLANGAHILSIPYTYGNYYLFELLDNWTNVFGDPGTRTMGSISKKILITNANDKFIYPNNLVVYRSNTNIVWIIGRIYWNGYIDKLEEFILVLRIYWPDKLVMEKKWYSNDLVLLY
ncbi:MAG: DUF1254 domain-containing protein [Satyrvirus sp.]|uniref:DUF1254 domain-containing protein n=1 Tax=Satyrvirus sp. TaxID=2487771 RepID=A0A3G5ADJ2_9VIRU|nr:MAG: DUF1254 domain-containing protein [Satyrvirus sp.]